MVSAEDNKTYTFFQVEAYNRGVTRYIIQDSEDELYWGQQSRSLEVVQRIHPESVASLPRQPFRADVFFPPFDPQRTTKFSFPGPESPDVFIKKQDFITDPRFLSRSKHYFELMQREIYVAEVLSRSPHKNVCPYLGAVVDDKLNRVTGMAYKRYTCDLDAYVDNGMLQYGSQIDKIMLCITAGVKHLHRLGFVHCDLRPPNIFLALPDKAKCLDDHALFNIDAVVVGDFDAVTPVGVRIKHKIAREKWIPRGVGFRSKASVKIDQYTLTKVEAWLWRKLKSNYKHMNRNF